MRIPCALLFLVLVAGCATPHQRELSDASAESDAGVVNDGQTLPPDAPEHNVDGGVVDGGTCTTMATADPIQVGCDELEMAVMHFDDGPTRLDVYGRLFGLPETDACVHIDSVAVLNGEAVLQTLGGIGDIALDSADHKIATGASFTNLDADCSSDDGRRRFETYGLRVYGTSPSGSFVAQCARAESGTRWPPALRVTCHRNVDSRADFGSADVTNTSYMGMTLPQSSVHAFSAHEADRPLTSLGSDAFVVPYQSSFSGGAPIASFNTSGWSASVSEPADGRNATLLSLYASSAMFDTTLCPEPSSFDPSVPPEPRPVFLLRFTGANVRGPISTEVFISDCYTTTIVAPHS